jgi:N-dimethylarginine dimethylaminohydrolase
MAPPAAPGFGVRNMTDPLRRVLVKRPEEAFALADPVAWGYAGRPELGAARAEHEALVEILRGAGAEVVGHDEAQPGRADAVFVFDPVLMTERGAVVLSLGKPQRRGEEEALARRLEALGVPILARFEAAARAEGGDLLRLDERTLAAGLGLRTNAEGAGQLATALAPLGIAVETVELPYFRGPRSCLHLLSLVSLLDRDLAVVYLPLLSVPFWRRLQDLGFRLVAVPDEEFATQASNVLALAPRLGLMLEGSPITRRRLEEAGCEIRTYRGRELSLKAEGGPTCLTLPLLRVERGRAEEARPLRK